MKKWLLFLTACVLSLFLFGSCRSTKVETITEYVPVEIDLTGVIEPVYELRPDNSQLQIITDVQTTLDIVNNSIQYQKAWELWQLYAETLEQTIASIQEVYGPKAETNL